MTASNRLLETGHIATKPRSRSRPTLLGNARLALFAAFVLYYLVAFYHFPPVELLSNPPISRGDYRIHFHESYAVAEILTGSGHAWGYDPFFAAGYPVGAVFDIDNKLVEVFVFAFHFLGDPLAYNIFVLLTVAAIPFLTYWTTRNFGLAPWGSVLAVGLALAVWDFSSNARGIWQVGLFTFVTASFVAPFLLSLFYVCLGRPRRLTLVLLALTAAAAVWLHPLTAVIAGVPGLLLYLWHRRDLAPAQHLSFAAIALFVLLVNLYWFLPFLQFHWILTDSSVHLQGGVPSLLLDLEDIVGAAGDRSPRLVSVQWGIFALATLGLYEMWRTARRALAAALGAGILLLDGLAYFGVYWPAVADIQPYRFIVSATVLALVPAAVGLKSAAEVLRPRRSWQSWAAVGAALLLIVSLARAVFYLHPPIVDYFTITPTDDRLLGPSDRELALFAWLRDATGADARIISTDPSLGALIPYFAKRQVIGGPIYPFFIQQGFANVGRALVFSHDINTLKPAELLQYLQTFNVQWIIFDPLGYGGRSPSSIGKYIDGQQPSFIHQDTTLMDYRIYRVDIHPSFFLQGSGLANASFNQIQVQGASPGPVVLKYHWLATFKTDPPLELAPYPVLDDPVPFIRVENGNVRDFVIYNGY